MVRKGLLNDALNDDDDECEDEEVGWGDSRGDDELLDDSETGGLDLRVG